MRWDRAIIPQSFSDGTPMLSLSIDELYASLNRRLRQFIRNRVSDESAIDDLLQEIFLKIHSRIDTLSDESKLESWVYQIARNAIVDYYRSRQNSGSTGGVDVAEELTEEDALTTLSTAIRPMIDQLPDEYRDALILTDLEGLTQKELAERVGLSLSGAKSRVQRARSMLRDLLMQCCHFQFDRFGSIIDYHPKSCCCCKQANP